MESNIYKLEANIKKQYIEYLKIILKIQESCGLLFKTKIEKETYIKLIEQVVVLEKQASLSNEQTTTLQRIKIQIKQIEQSCKVDYNGIIKKLIDEQIRVATILIIDETIKKEYQKLLDDLESAEENIKIKFRDFLQRMIYTKLILEYQQLTKIKSQQQSDIERELKLIQLIQKIEIEVGLVSISENQRMKLVRILKKILKIEEEHGLYFSTSIQKYQYLMIVRWI